MKLRSGKNTHMIEKMNIPEIINTIKTTEDDKLKIKLLSSLITTLHSLVPRERDEIVTSSVVYEAAHTILSRGVVEGSTSVLSFLTALLRVASLSEDEARAPAARELLRRSGCLQDMLHMFLGTENMEHDCLKILCDCIVESCKHCEYNQNDCNPLIPACLQRLCDTNNNEILKLLNCLLLKNTANINTFVECNGIRTIFTRDSFQDSSRRDLVSRLVQNSMAAKLLQRDTDLMEFLFSVDDNHQLNHQGSWKMVEWATVVLLHILSHVERPFERSSNIMDNENEIDNTGSSLSDKDLSVSFLFKSNWDKIRHTNVLKNNKTGNTISEYITGSSAKIIQKSGLEALSGDQIGVELVTENNFKPAFTSTPKRKFKHDNKTRVAEEQKWNNDLQTNLCCQNSGPVVKKKLSISARLFNMVDNSCISIYNMKGNVFIPSAQREDLLKPNIQAGSSKCRFNNNVKQRELLHTGLKGSVQLGCHKPLTRKVGISNKYRKDIIKKLKTGIYFYGCNFKKIAQAMWPQEKQMTAQVLYSIYRKFIVK